MTILHIIRREFLTRVRRKTFLMTTLLGPVIMAVMMILPYWLVSDDGGEVSNYQVLVHDPQQRLSGKTTELAGRELIFMETNAESVKTAYQNSDATAMLMLLGPNQATFYFKQKNPTQEALLKSEVQMALSENAPKLHWESSLLMGNDANKSGALLTFLSYASVIFIYFFIFLYGIQVMKGIVEEKTNRIIEVMVSTVRPWQLMLGKILGISLLGLTQFFVWFGLSGLLGWWLSDHFQMHRFSDEMLQQTLSQGVNADLAMEMNTLVSAFSQIDFGTFALVFTFYFLGGYLLYGALFAVVGSASDADTDTQQFIFPLTVPLLFSVIMVQPILKDVHSPVAKFMSIFPFTSPITMMARMPFLQTEGGFWGELLLSMLCLIIGFVVVTWIASRIYRVGILVYGKKVGYGDLLKWMKN